MEYEYAFEMAASNIRFGPGVTREVGMDLAELKAQRVMVVTDPAMAKLAPVATVLESTPVSSPEGLPHVGAAPKLAVGAGIGMAPCGHLPPELWASVSGLSFVRNGPN